MKSISKKSLFFLITLSIFGLYSCNKEVKSGPNFIYKAAPDNSTAASINGEKITVDQMNKGIEIDVYDAQMKLYDLKMGKLKALILEKFINADPRKKSLTNDQFLEKYIASTVKVSEKDVQDFVVKRKIPKQHLDDNMKGRIKKFLAVELKREAIDNWVSQKSIKSPVEIYLQKPKRPTFDINITAASPALGPASAKVTLVEFSDFQCPFCAKGATILKQLKEKYGKKLRVVFKNFPLPFHKDAVPAALAGLCANEQGNNYFWKMHDAMFADQSKLKSAALVATAKGLGMDEAKFKSCLDTSKYKSQLDADVADGQKAGVKSTPTFYVNGQMINGAHPLEVFSEIIDDELKK
jgi:protein-disulfide isomerase